MQEYEAMLEESRDIKIGFRYSQARTLFEDDPRWKVSNGAALARTTSSSHTHGMPMHALQLPVWSMCVSLSTRLTEL